MDILAQVCSELLTMIIMKDWHDARISIDPVTYEIHAVTFERDTYNLCSADGWDDYGLTYKWAVAQR
jgi:hypothetical protein